MSWDRTETPALSEEAAHWLIELEEPGADTLRRFAAWLETSPRHVEEFLLVAAVWKAFDNMDAERRLDIQTLLNEARSNVRPLGSYIPRAPAESSTVVEKPRRIRAFALAAVVVLAVVTGVTVWLFQHGSPQIYATAHGEQRALKLEDGSVIYLNTQSRVEVRFSRQTRAIRLLEGEAMFDVEHDAARPFRVMAGHTVIQAIGTRFNVQRAAAGATVSVVEGVVQISQDEPSIPPSISTPTQMPNARQAAEPHPARVSAGEQAQVLGDGEIVTRAVPDLAQVVAWRERRLVFRGDSLAQVAAEFNRYNALQIRVEGDAVRNKQMTGVFDADDPRSFVQFLKRDNSLLVEEGAQDITIRSR